MRTLVVTLAIAIFASCSAPPAPAPTLRGIAERADSIARVFESPLAFSPLVLDSITVRQFLTDHPEYSADSAGIAAFYMRRGGQFAWFAHDSLGTAAHDLLNLIAGTDTSSAAAAAEVAPWVRTVHALVAQLDTVPTNDSLRTCTELTLTGAFFRIANARYEGYVRRDLRELDWYIPRRKKNMDRLLDSLVAGVNDLGPIEPVHPQYRALKEHLRRYAALDTLPWSPLDMRLCERRWPAPPDSSGAFLRHRLFLLGDIPVDDGSNSWDSLLHAGVRRAQHRHGLKETGWPDEALVGALNITPVERVRTLLVNMERLRWVPSEPAPDQIMVNIPEFRMHIFEHDTIAWGMDVVVGAEATRTAVFAGELNQVVMAPYWNIPQSIIRDEILPAVKRDRHYLEGKNMEVVSGGQVVPSRTIDWKKYSTGVPFSIRQRPGRGNALGRVKFLFPNAYSIYFHDTPAKDKFQRERRAFSHGCIRLREPQRLAEYLLQEDPSWPPERIRMAMNSTNEVTVRLARPRPVLVGYFTAWVEQGDILHFREDIYGHDRRLGEELFAPATVGATETGATTRN